MEYNNEHYNLSRNGNVSTSNNSVVSAFTSPAVKPTNDKVCSLFSTINEKIKYSYLSKTKSRAVGRAIDLTKSQTYDLVKT